MKNLIFTTLALFMTVSAMAQDSSGENREWYKGNTHTHTLNSDGDSTPDEVVTWYREHDYNFLVLSDHNFLTSVAGLNDLHGADGKFLVIRGEEVSDAFKGKPIHVNGLDLGEEIEPQGGESVLDVLQRDVDAIRQAGGVPHVNHPNYEWAISAEDLARLKNTRLIEIFNGHPKVNNVGGGGYPGLEEMWDAVLSSGVLVYGIAVDDAHHFKRPDDPSASKPGQGWIVVRAPELSADAIVGAMERGDFYASTGVTLKDYEVTGDAVTITLPEAGSTRFTVSFIGKGGKVLERAISNPAVYTFRGDEGYVRARVVDSNGLRAWTQPVIVSSTGS